MGAVEVEVPQKVSGIFRFQGSHMGEKSGHEEPCQSLYPLIGGASAGRQASGGEVARAPIWASSEESNRSSPERLSGLSTHL